MNALYKFPVNRYRWYALPVRENIFFVMLQYSIRPLKTFRFWFYDFAHSLDRFFGFCSYNFPFFGFGAHPDSNLGFEGISEADFQISGCHNPLRFLVWVWIGFIFYFRDEASTPASPCVMDWVEAWVSSRSNMVASSVEQSDQTALKCVAFMSRGKRWIQQG